MMKTLAPKLSDVVRIAPKQSDLLNSFIGAVNTYYATLPENSTPQVIAPSSTSGKKPLAPKEAPKIYSKQEFINDLAIFVAFISSYDYKYTRVKAQRKNSTFNPDSIMFQGEDKDAPTVKQLTLLVARMMAKFMNLDKADEATVAQFRNEDFIGALKTNKLEYFGAKVTIYFANFALHLSKVDVTKMPKINDAINSMDGFKLADGTLEYSYEKLDKSGLVQKVTLSAKSEDICLTPWIYKGLDTEATINDTIIEIGFVLWLSGYALGYQSKDYNDKSRYQAQIRDTKKDFVAIKKSVPIDMQKELNGIFRSIIKK